VREVDFWEVVPAKFRLELDSGTKSRMQTVSSSFAKAERVVEKKQKGE